jgi:plastocyanin
VRLLRLPLIFLLVLVATVLAPGSARPGTTSTLLSGTVGPGFTITLKDANGSVVSHLDPGEYTITVQNLSDPTSGVVHNFHLRGTGVNQLTSFDPGTTTWTVTFVDGTYTYLCDAHPTQMKKTFTVGNPPPPPPPPPAVKKLKGKVGPGSTIALKKTSGSLVRTLKAGRYAIAVRDASTKDNFHLLGPRVSKKTGVRPRGSVTWRVTLRAGKYAYFSDAHRKLRRTFRVVK